MKATRSHPKLDWNKKVHLSTAVLVMVAFADLASTIKWLSIGGQEGNPLFARFWEMGPLVFILAKAIYVAFPIAILEWVRTKRPISAEVGTWVAGLAYLAIWGSHLVALQNHIR